MDYGKKESIINKAPTQRVYVVAFIISNSLTSTDIYE